jgi:hypothetical protein
MLVGGCGQGIFLAVTVRRCVFAGILVTVAAFRFLSWLFCHFFTCFSGARTAMGALVITFPLIHFCQGFVQRVSFQCPSSFLRLLNLTSRKLKLYG